MSDRMFYILAIPQGAVALAMYSVWYLFFT
jgi:hypothetical protein